MNFCHLYELGRVSILSMSRFLETDTREQQKYEKRIQPSVDNTVKWSESWNQVSKACEKQK